jgi:hypothetical protein
MLDSTSVAALTRASELDGKNYYEIREFVDSDAWQAYRAKIADTAA